jgi:hypothetical protein
MAMPKYLEDLEAARKFSVEADVPAGTWFALHAEVSMKAQQYEQAYWEARAAIEAEPTNAEHHVAFGLASYQVGNFEAVKAVGRVLPCLAPTATNAWMLFALSESLSDEPQPELTKSAFVLAIRLSRNPETTRRYFKELAQSAKNAVAREMLYAALAEDRENPELFAGVVALRNSLNAR